MPNVHITFNSRLRQIYSMLRLDWRPAYDAESVGIDLYNASYNQITIPPGETKLVNTGVKVRLPLNHVALVKERGSIIKSPLMVRAGVVDPGYTGDIFVAFHNLSNRSFTIPCDAKLPAQLLIMPTIQIDAIDDVSNEVFEELVSASSRGEGKIGSSD